MKKIIRMIMLLRGYTYVNLADKMGYNTATSISNMVNREKGMRVDNLLRLLDAMDCELVVRSKLADKSEWVVK